MCAETHGPEPAEKADEFQFTADWFSANIPHWTRLFAEFLPHASRILEIGTYEGRSTAWLAENAFMRGNGGSIFCIDSWSGGEEHDKARMAEVEGRFDHNRSVAEKRFPPTTIRKLKGQSHDQMIRLLAHEGRETFDFIYVDGSHQAPDVLGDLILAMMLCKPNGVIVCDDYLWGEGNENVLHRPKIAIDSFTNCFAGRIRVIYGFPLYQIHMIKTKN